MSLANNDKSDRGYSPTLIVATILVFLIICILGAFLFIRSREQGRWRLREQTLRAQEWVRVIEELGIGVQMPALHEVVLGGTTKARLRAGDLTKFNERTWKELMVCQIVWNRWRNAD